MDAHANTKPDPTYILAPEHICERRAYLTVLIKAVAIQEPAAIAIDYHHTSPCPGVDDEFRRTLKEVSSRLPVVLGEKGTTAEKFQESSSWQIVPPFDPNDIALHAPAGGEILHVDYAPLMMAKDTRQVPLQWMTAKELDPPKEPRIRVQGPSPTPQLYDRHSADTFALQAAEAYEGKNLILEKPLQRFIHERIFPLTSFISEKELNPQSGLSIICPDPGALNDWTKCVARQDRASRLRGHLVVIGAKNREDFHASVLGENTPGAVLQTNYIESILDSRLFGEAPWQVKFLLSVITFALIEAAFEYFSESRTKQNLGHTSRNYAIIIPVLLGVAVIIIAYCVGYIALLSYGIYLNFWTPTVWGLLLNLGSKLSLKSRESYAPEPVPQAQ